MDGLDLDYARLIVLSPLVIGADVGAVEPFTDITYIYSLGDASGPWYIGSTVNPVSRYLSHLTLATKDTADKIGELRALGELPIMEILDVTVRSDRLPLESKWINETVGTINTTRYERIYALYLECPACHRAASTGTL